MKVLLWLRALLDTNFHNWNNKPSGFHFVAYSVQDTRHYDIGVKVEITSINRTTGLVTVKYAD
jgi:hypothetical protein